MKKQVILCIIFILGFSTFEVEASFKNSSKTAFSISTKDRFGKKRKDGSFKRRRSGFLGLFGKRNSCGCPN